jgi:hypothetical protein
MVIVGRIKNGSLGGFCNRNENKYLYLQFQAADVSSTLLSSGCIRVVYSAGNQGEGGLGGATAGAPQNFFLNYKSYWGVLALAELFFLFIDLTCLYEYYLVL